MELKKFSFLEKKGIDEGKSTYVFVASKEVVDRTGDLVRVAGIDTSNFEKNPVFLMFHNYSEFPIGKVVNLTKDNDTFYIEVEFAEETEEGRKAKYLVDNGYMKAVSVGFIPKKTYTKDGSFGYPSFEEMKKEYSGWYDMRKDEIEKAERVFTELELLEVSLVPVPANQDALLVMASKGLKKAYTMTKDYLGEDDLIEIDLPELKNAVRYSEHPANMKKDETSAWDRDKADMSLRKWASRDGSGEKETIIWNKYRKGFGWYDANVLDNFGSYKLPHHWVKDGDFYVVWRGVVAGMVALLGGRGGVNIPAEDKKSVYNHLARHYRDDFGKEPPKYKEVPYTLEEAIKNFDEEHLEEFIKFLTPSELKELVSMYEEKITSYEEKLAEVGKRNEELKLKVEELENKVKSLQEEIKNLGNSEESKFSQESDTSPSDKEAEVKEVSEDTEDLFADAFPIEVSPEEFPMLVKSLLKKFIEEEK